MRSLLLIGALALVGLAGTARAQSEPTVTVTEDGSELQVEAAPVVTGGATRTPAVPETISVDPPRLVTERTYGKQDPGQTTRWNDPIQVRKSFAPELQRSAQNLD